MTNFEQGFIDKCAEHGVDANELLKEAGKLDALKKGGKKLWGKAKATGRKAKTEAKNKAREIVTAVKGKASGKKMTVDKLKNKGKYIKDRTMDRLKNEKGQNFKLQR